MSKRRYGRRKGERRSYLKYYDSSVTKPTGKARGQSARSIRRIFTEEGYGLVGTNPTSTEPLPRRRGPLSPKEYESKRHAQVVEELGEIKYEWASKRFQGVDVYHKIKVVDLPYLWVWMYFSGNQYFFRKFDHPNRRAWDSEMIWTKERAHQKLTTDSIVWMEEIDYHRTMLDLGYKLVEGSYTRND